LSSTRKHAIYLPLVATAIFLAFVLDVSGATDPCGPGANEVSCENAKPGNPPSEWDIVGMGDPSIQGFATEFSVNHGETVDFKVKTDAAAYRLDVYRMGWYGGNGARKIATVTPSATLPQSQPACLTDASTGLVDCGNWATSASWAVPATAVSGIYFARLVRTDTGGDSHVFFIVRDDEGASELLFQTSDTTWQAYNRYGGNSLYVGSPASRAYKVSYNRPFTTRDFASPSFVWEDEYPMVRWLERNGYDVSYTSGIDTDRRGAELLEHEAFLSVGHDEYWSGQQRANVEAARNAGMDLAFFSSNEIFWKTRWEASIDGSGRPYRTLVSYKETKANAKIDPNAAWTGTWRDPRFTPPGDGGRPENALTGQLFTVDAYINAGIRVPAELARMRLWRNTSIASLAPDAAATLPVGTLGHEFDEDVDNGHRPPGLLALSSTTLDVAKHLQDHGNTYAPGTATHSLSLYRHASGALVFGAGTSQWSWGLDGEHDYWSAAVSPAAADSRVQQATVNLFADMGVQPALLQSDLVAATASTDTAAPSSTITSPASGTGVPGRSSVTIKGTATDGGGGVVGAVEVSLDGGATWHRATGRGSWSYTSTVGGFGLVSVKSRAVDDSGNIESPSAGITLSVSCPCTIWDQGAQPATASTGDTKSVELGVKFRPDVSGFVTGVRFYKGPANTGTHVGSLWTAAGALLARATFTYETAGGWQEVTFDAPVPVTAGTTYVASYFAPAGGYSLDVFEFAAGDVENAPLRALRDGVDGGNGVFSYGSSSSFPTQTNKSSNYWVDVAFDTIVRPDVTAPAITAVTPADGASNVDYRGDVAATFSEAMDATSVDAVSFELRDASNAVVPASVTYSASARAAILSPTVALDRDATYTATVKGGSSGIKDKAGNPVASPKTWSFRTLPPRVCPCTLWNVLSRPRVESSTDTKAVELGVKFRADQSGYVTGVRFYKGAKNTGTHVGSLWTASGILLARATFAGEAATGWQEVAFDAPVPVTADTTYVASYYAPFGSYAVDTGYFASAYADPPLRALRDGVQGGNGAFLYGTASAFPTQTSQSSNYWVDVTFDTELRPDTTPPRVVDPFPAPGTASADARGAVTATFTEAIDAATVGPDSIELRDETGTRVPGAVGYDAVTRTLHLAPSAPLAYGASYAATVRGGAGGVRDRAGNPLAGDVTWTFATAPPRACPCSIWPETARPALESSTDTKAVEVGVKFRSDEPGYVSGIRFYKGAKNTGTHVGSLWTSAGALLGRVTFVGETATGWQTAYLAAPVAIAADTTYVASYFAPVGGYSLDTSYFAVSGFVDPPLRSLRDGAQGGNGAFVYNPTSRFPTTSNRASNYWVDLVYERNPAVLETAPGTAVRPGTSIPVATGGTNAMALDFGAAASVHAFGDVFTVTNVSAEPQTVTVSLAGVPQLDAATFDVSGTATATLEPGASSSVSVRSSELAAGRGTGKLVLGLAGGGVPYRSYTATIETAPQPVAALTARPGPGGRINLAWPASPTTVNLRGYNVYRSSGGAYSLLTPTLVAATAYADLSTIDGGSYTYLVRAAGTGPTVPESADSPEASAAADGVAPEAGAPTPPAGAADVAPDALVTVAFGESMDPATLTAQSFALRTDDGAAVAAAVSYDDTSDTATLTPAAPLAEWTRYTVTLKGGAGGATDLAGNALASDLSWTFTTENPFLVEAGPAVQAGTSTPIASETADGLALDFGTVPSARVFTGVVRVTNVSARSQTAGLSIRGIAQLATAAFESSGAATATLAPGEATYVSVGTSFFTAGLGVGSVRLALAGGGLFSDFATSIVEAPEPAVALNADPRAGGLIALDWHSSATKVNVAGYNVYRSSGGPFVKLNAAPIAGIAYDDAATVDGIIYTYVVRTVATGTPQLESLDGDTDTAQADARASGIGGLVPASGAAAVPVTTTVKATFDEPMTSSTINGTTVQLRTAAGALVAASVSYHAPSRTVTLTPNAALAVGTQYRATIRGGAAGVADGAGNWMAADFTWTFSTPLPISVTPGTAVRPGTTTPIATGSNDTLSLNFGTVPSARTITNVFTVRNTSTASVQLTLAPVGVSQIASTVFASSGSATATLAANATSNVTVTTSSTVAGYGTGSIRISMSAGAVTRSYPATIAEAPQAPASIAAVPQAAGRIAVSWAASTSTTNLAGYNVYRATGTTYTKLNAATLTGTAYTDATAVNGTLYTYRVRAVSTGSPALLSLDSPTSAAARSDATAPAQPTSLALANGGGTGNAYVNLANRAALNFTVGVGSASLATDTLTVTLRSGTTTVSKTSAARTGAGTVTVTGINGTALPDGTVTISVTSRDLAGNTSTARSITATKDAVAPGVPTAAYTDNLNPAADRITGTAQAGSFVSASRTAPTAAGPYTTTATSTGAYGVNVAASRGQTVTYRITARDPAGNTGAARTLTFTTTR
jgi:fibronectin type 3 domain-containing protein